MSSIPLVNNRFFPRAQAGGGGPDAGPWDEAGGIVSLDNSAWTVAIGAGAMSGGEKVRIVGSLRVEGQVLGDTLRAEDTSGGTAAFLELDDGVSAGVSAVGEARIRFNDTSNQVEVSENGGAYTPIFAPTGGGWTDDGLIVRLTTSTDDVVVGGVATVGAERLRVVGAIRVEGQAFSQNVRIEDGTAAFLEMDDGSTAAVSGASEGRLRYNASTQRFEVSENTAAYVALVPQAGPWERVGTVVSLDTDTDAVVIGASAVAGTETLRHTAGSALFDGVVGAVPVSGAGTRMLWAPASAALRAGVVTGTAWDAANVGARSVAFGSDTIASGSESAAFGDDTEAPAAHSFAFGEQSQAARIGQLAQANGQVASRGDSQRSTIVARRQTLDATPIEATLDGAAPAGAAVNTSNRIILEDDTSYTFEALVVARNTLASESKMWTLAVAVKRDVGAATVAIVGTQLKVMIGQTAPAASSWDVNFVADAVNGSLQPEVTGQLAKTINWTWDIRFAEVAV